MQAQQVPQMSLVSGKTAFRTEFGSFMLPPCAKVVAYVRATPISQAPPEVEQLRVTTLTAALARCRSGVGDVIVVLPGHTENVSATHLSGLVAGTRIIGAAGPGAAPPTFTWNAAGSTWAINVANVHIEGLRLNLGGADSVTKAINITGSDCSLVGNDIIHATSNVLDTAISIEVGTGADRCTISGNQMRGAAAGTTVDGIKVVAAVANFRLLDNEMFFAATAATGQVQFTAAATDILIARNTMSNTVASSAACISIATATAVTGIIKDNDWAVLNTGTATSGTVGIAFPGSPSTTVACFRNLVVNDPRTSGVLKPTVDS